MGDFASVMVTLYLRIACVFLPACHDDAATMIRQSKIELSTRGLHQERQFLPKAGYSGMARLRHVPPLSGYWHNLVNVAARVFITNSSNRSVSTWLARNHAFPDAADLLRRKLPARRPNPEEN